MAIFDLFSKRQKILRGEIPSIYTYDALPVPLKIQITYIISDAIGTSLGYRYPDNDIYKFINDTLCREYGMVELNSGYTDSYKEAVFLHFRNSNDVEHSIDFVELCFKCIQNIIGQDSYYYQSVSVKMQPDDAIDELNQRLKQHGIGYQFTGGEIIKVDSTYTHSEIVKPTITLLWSSTFAGANEEYLKAHEHYRHGRNKECLAECLSVKDYMQRKSMGI